MNADDKNEYPFGTPTEELDEPIDYKEGYFLPNKPVETMQLSKEDYVKELDKDRNDKRYYKAFNLIFACLGMLAFLYVFDYIVYAITGYINKNFSSMIEILKALLFSLSGYLFATKNKE